MAGLSFDIALGSWLLKSELAYLHGLEFFALPGEKKSRLDALVGVTYSGLSETLISIEIANRHMFDFVESLGNEPDSALEDDLQFAFRVTREFMHDRLMLKLIVMSFGALGENGALERLDLTFDCTDNLSTTIGLVLYQSGKKQSFNAIGDNDRIFAELKFSY